jgi:hypothetical protein
MNSSRSSPAGATVSHHRERHRRARRNIGTPRGSKTSGSRTSLAPLRTLLPNLFFLFVVLFGLGTVVLHNLAQLSLTSQKTLPHGLGAFHDGFQTDRGSERMGGNNDAGNVQSSNDLDPKSPFHDQRTWYKALRESFETEHASTMFQDVQSRSYSEVALTEFVKQLHGDQTFSPLDKVSGHLAYNVFDCPSEPPPNYPIQFPLVELLAHWNPDNITLKGPVHPIHIGLCVFDYTRAGHYEASLTYRSREVPFVLRYHPSLLPTVYRWNHPSYMNDLLKEEHLPKQRTESSPNNHFMFWRLDKRKKKPQPGSAEAPSGWQAPTENIELAYSEWLSHANVTTLKGAVSNDDTHYYFRMNGCPEGALKYATKVTKKLLENKNEVINEQDAPAKKCPQLFMFDELPYFTPYAPESKDFLIDPSEFRGINCRFGMEGAIAENHFDMSRNLVTVLKGQRRYILSHPNQCGNMALYPKEHPSGRHSIVDWSDIDSDPSWRTDYPEFYNLATANEVVLQAGDSLYLPTNWMHYIISLNLNYQCNARSGRTDGYDSDIAACGFG